MRRQSGGFGGSDFDDCDENRGKTLYGSFGIDTVVEVLSGGFGGGGDAGGLAKIVSGGLCDVSGAGDGS
jgi:hypothetical protein